MDVPIVVNTTTETHPLQSRTDSEVYNVEAEQNQIILTRSKIHAKRNIFQRFDDWLWFEEQDYFELQANTYAGLFKGRQRLALMVRVILFIVMYVTVTLSYRFGSPFFTQF